MSKRPMVPLGAILSKSEDWITLEPDKQYSEVTVRLWGRGVVLRGQVTGADIAGARRLRVRSNQFILSRIDARNGAIGLVPDSLDGAVVTNDFPVYSLNNEQVASSFLGWMSKTATFVELCKRASEGTTNRVRLKEDRFLSTTVPLPPLPEQLQIVARIESLAARIDEAHGLRQCATDEADRLYASALSCLMEPHGSAWKRETVGDVIVGMDAGWSPQCDDVPARAGEWGVLKTTSVQWCKFHPMENKALPATLGPVPELCVQEGDVLVTRAGPRKRVGVVAAVRKTDPRLTISDKLIRLRPDKTKVILPRNSGHLEKGGACSPRR